MNNKVASLLSLCMKAGKLQAGETMAEKLLQDGTAQLVIIAGDASDNTKNKFINKSFYYKKPALVYGDKMSLSKCIGKQNRATLVITDAGFALRLQTLIQETPERETINQTEVVECPKSAYTS